MTDSLDVAATAAGAIQADQLERVRQFTREPIVLEGETVADILPGTARHRAIEAALAELEEGHETPSPEWRRQYSLLLGLERLLSTEPVHLAKDTELTEHQVDVLSGTLAALTTELEDSHHDDRSNGARLARGEANGEVATNGEAGGNGAVEAIEEDEGAPDEEEPPDWEARAGDLVPAAPRRWGGAPRGPRARGARGSGREPALLVRARNRIWQDRRRAGLHRGVAN